MLSYWTCVLVIWMTFQEILEFLNFLYSIGMILEFAAFIRLRIKKPDLHRPYRIPLQTTGVTMLCVPPTLLLVLVMCLASLKTFLVSGTVILMGFLSYPLVIHAKDKKSVRFEAQEGLPPDDNQVGHFVKSKLPQEGMEDATVTLLSESASSKTQQDLSLVVVEEVLKLG